MKLIIEIDDTETALKYKVYRDEQLDSIWNTFGEAKFRKEVLAGFEGVKPKELDF